MALLVSVGIHFTSWSQDTCWRFTGKSTLGQRLLNLLQQNTSYETAIFDTLPATDLGPSWENPDLNHHIILSDRKLANPTRHNFLLPASHYQKHRMVSTSMTIGLLLGRPGSGCGTFGNKRGGQRRGSAVDPIPAEAGLESVTAGDGMEVTPPPMSKH